MEEEKSRLKKFQMIRSQIRQSDSVLLVGIDVAKNQHHAFFGTPQGKTLDSSLVPEMGA